MLIYSAGQGLNMLEDTFLLDVASKDLWQGPILIDLAHGNISVRRDIIG